MESRLHELLKRAVFNELEKDGYDLHFEPCKSPLVRVRWNSYRPDILGVIVNQTELRLAVAECETNPRLQCINEKERNIRRRFTFQKRVNEEHDLRLLLVTPPGMLHRVNSSGIRRLWEIWIISCKGEIMLKIPRNEPPAGD